ncbi:PTS beta-glucoside transporter subunit IIBCA [Labedella phragmitis]|uniref:PTS beta-glucoside transporter subunit IIBCA n=1 Tax=Labedella phragmitis TaxID=2498849 RepID=A0A444PSI7_9MICO|nr:beta-glucoside-specific PTS transporter subunit IIABC [Labedella phragmitis]RWZ50831.1 PTS beta-glucoside transporter subunit IIBCA [Labedella phragmitis]
MDYGKTAAGVLAGVGGGDNVASVVHCATRLRFELKDTAKADPDAIRSIPGVITTAEAGGQFQVVIGNEVPEVYAEIAKTTGGAPGERRSKERDDAAKPNVFNRFIAMISALFSPLLWVLAAAGLLKALLSASVAFGWIDSTTTTYAMLNAISDGFFYFLPVILAVTAAKYFEANQMTSMAMAAALVYPAIVALDGQPDVSFFGIPVVMVSYVSSVIPVIIMVWLQSHVERFLYAKLHSSIRRLFTPMIVLLILVSLTFLVIGPLANAVSSGLAAGIGWLFDYVPALGGAITGGLWQVFVIFGVHWGIIPLMIVEFQENGNVALLAPIFAAVLAQAGAVLGVLIRTRSKQLRALSAPAAISAFLAGVTEPAIYGINLPLKRPFAFGIVGGAVGGAIIAAGGITANAFVLASGLSLPVLFGSGSVWVLLIALAVSIVVPFVLVLVFGFTDRVDDAPVTASPDLQVVSPLDGTAVPLSQVPDAAFADGSLGQGIAIVPTGGTLFAPVAGEVVAVFPTGHAIGIRSEDGVEILIHIGINTVELGGEHFSVTTEKGATVAAGDVLVEFDTAAIAAAGYDLTTPIIVTNDDAFPTIGSPASGAIRHGDPLYLAIASEAAAAR